MSNIKLQGNKVRLYVPSIGRTVTAGLIMGDTYVKPVQDKHRLHTPPAYAIQQEIYQYLVATGIKKVTIRETKNKQEWYSTIEQWQDKGMDINRGRAGNQRALMLQYMDVKDGQNMYKPGPIKIEPKQPTLRKGEYICKRCGNKRHSKKPAVVEKSVCFKCMRDAPDPKQESLI